MVDCTSLALSDCTFEVLTDRDRFLGLGRITIGGVAVRSGRLPIHPYTETFTGHEISSLRWLGAEETAGSIRLKIEAVFRPSKVKMMRDHSFDPIHETGDWVGEENSGVARLDIVLKPAHETLGGEEFSGFSYHYEYAGEQIPVFYLLDHASWELDGDIQGATVFSQSSCSNPVVTFDQETSWSTEGELHFLDPASYFNRIMTHNLPRWTDHQAFDYQFRQGKTLIGVFDHVDLIRTVLRREAGKPELKTFDKHIFDESTSYRTSPKKILLNAAPRSPVAERNLWTWISDEIARRARAEFGLKETPCVPTLAHHYWQNYNVDTAYRDILPAAIAIGARAIFAENFKKNDTSDGGLPQGNMCCSQEYEISDRLGGSEKFRDYIARCQKQGIKNFMWTNTYVSLAAKLNAEQRDPEGWYMAMEDTRIKYAGAYTMVSSNLDLKNPEVRRYWVDAHLKIAKETGLEGYYIDSHYNLFFMPVNFKTGHPRTVWRESLEVMKEMQDAGIEWMIEAFGPFGQSGHGHHSSYNAENAFICYLVGLGNGHVTVPVAGMEATSTFAHDPAFVFYLLAHKIPCALPLFIEEKRIDEVYGEEHRRILREYHDCLPEMSRRFLQEDSKGVIWHNKDGDHAMLWNFEDRTVALPGKVRDVTSGELLPSAKTYELRCRHIYRLEDCKAPASVG